MMRKKVMAVFLFVCGISLSLFLLRITEQSLAEDLIVSFACGGPFYWVGFSLWYDE